VTVGAGSDNYDSKDHKQDAFEALVEDPSLYAARLLYNTLRARLLYMKWRWQINKLWLGFSTQMLIA